MKTARSFRLAVPDGPIVDLPFPAVRLYDLPTPGLVLLMVARVRALYQQGMARGPVVSGVCYQFDEVAKSIARHNPNMKRQVDRLADDITDRISTALGVWAYVTSWAGERATVNGQAVYNPAISWEEAYLYRRAWLDVLWSHASEVYRASLA